ncbi:quinone oxidoreductase, partial [Elysia marginata]
TVFLVPDNLSLVEAAGTLTCYGTALMGLTRNARLRKREKVLVTAAAGATGLAAVDIAKNILGFEGRALTVGYASGNIPKIPANLMLLKSSSLVGVFWGNYATSNPQAWGESIMQVIQAVSQGKIKPYVGKTFPLDQINEAFDYISSRKNVGKTVIKIRDEDTGPDL